MDRQIELPQSYRVEVSGWDTSERFFVEKTTLDWGREADKEISLRSAVCQGSVVFVRLLQAYANSSNFPIAYQAVDVLDRDADGGMRVRLAQLRPRSTRKETAESASDLPINVA
jgi:hypothetical protein